MKTLHIAALLLAGAPAAAATMPQADNFHELESAGYVAMDHINTPLLYPLNSGKPYNAKVLLLNGRQSLPPELQQAARDLNDNNEFRLHATLQGFAPFLAGRMDALRHAQGYLVALNAKLGEYDFTRHRFPLALSLQVSKPKSADSYQCSGAYDEFRRTKLTACVSASNWNHQNPAFQYLAIDDLQRAEDIKRRLLNNKAGFFFVMQPEGRFRVVDNDKMKFGGFLDPSLVSGIQPARVLGLLLVDFDSGEILLSGAMADAAP